MPANSGDPPADPSRLETVIGYTFRHHAYLDLALTHPGKTHQKVDPANNQRLEFLGDAVLQILTSEALYRRFPEDREGELTRKRATLVNASHLADIGRQIELATYLDFGHISENLTDRALRSAVADACEALFGAVFLDGGLPAARTVFQKLFDLETIPRALDSNPKGTLQEWQQANLPDQCVEYLITDISGPDHAPVFTAEVAVGGQRLGTGSGSSKKIAESLAAGAALDRLLADD